jgi:hypothetical protein
MLAASPAHIKRANPGATILLGGMMDIRSRAWLARALEAGAAGMFDVANVHLRGTARGVVRDLRAWRRFFARRAFRGPLWVTEFGYPSAVAYQRDPAYGAGERGQAAYLADVLPALHHAGAEAIFVTLRDNLDGQFASEGLLAGDVSDPPSATPAVRRKPAVEAFRRVVLRHRRAKRAREVAQDG